MNKLERLIQKIRAEWSNPRYTTAEEEAGVFRQICKVTDRIQEVQNLFPFEIPQDVQLLWSSVEHADLFMDVEYSQWGLSLLSAEEAHEATTSTITTRSQDFLASDIVIGRFYGDADLLIICCESGAQFGSVRIALPIDSREEWYSVSDSLIEFLEEYIYAEGDKFWEQ